MEKYIVSYTYHYVYMDLDRQEIDESHPNNYICVYADSADEATEMVINNIKYSYTHYNTVDRVMRVADISEDKLSARAKRHIANPVNKENQKDWELNKRDILF